MKTDYKKRNITYRDNKHIKDSDNHKPIRGKKDRKKWCRGKVGVDHEPQCKNYHDVVHTSLNYAKNWKLLVCAKCGKNLDWYHPLQHKQPPDWAK